MKTKWWPFLSRMAEEAEDSGVLEKKNDLSCDVISTSAERLV